MHFFQKKVNFIVLALPILFSCSSHQKNERIILYQLGLNSQKSVQSLLSQTKTLQQSFHQKMEAVETAGKATLWYKKTEELKTISDGVSDYIDTIRFKLLKEAEIDNIDLETVCKDEKRNIVNSFFIDNGIAMQLYGRLNIFFTNILNSDPDIKKEFQNKHNILGTSFNGDEKDEELFKQIFFKDASLASVLTALSGLQEGIRRSENMITIYCHNQVAFDLCGYWKQPKPIAIQNSSYVRAGEPIEITAGFATFFPQVQPAFTIDNKKISEDYNGVAIYKINTTNKSGKYKVPVKIEYINPNGATETLEKTLTYEVFRDTTLHN